jgi:uncharacterized membrane protein
MTDVQTLAPAKPGRIRTFASGAIALAVIGAAVLLAPDVMNFSGVEIRPHAPDPALIAAAPPAIQIHLLAAGAAFFLGLMQFVLPKGTGLHRTTGWIWVLLIATAAVSSLFIRQLNHDAFSLIHILSGWTLVVLPMAVYAARRGEIAKHRGRMTGLFIGGLLIAGTLAFMPGRLMWRLFLGN